MLISAVSYLNYFHSSLTVQQQVSPIIKVFMIFRHLTNHFHMRVSVFVASFSFIQLNINSSSEPFGWRLPLDLECDQHRSRCTYCKSSILLIIRVTYFSHLFFYFSSTTLHKCSAKNSFFLFLPICVAPFFCKEKKVKALFSQKLKKSCEKLFLD